MTNPILRMACCAALASSALLFAVPGQAHPGGPAAGERMSRALDLTEAQQEALKQARREAMSTHREARKDGADRAELRREHAQRMREVYEGVLTREQLDKLDGMREERRSRQRDRLAETLDLHPDQVDPVQKILSEARRRAASQGDADGQERRAAVREQLSGILTPAQMERFDAMHSGRREAGLDRMMARISERLELHSSQIAPVREVLDQSFSDMREHMRELRSEQSAADGDRRAMHEAMGAERERIAATTREQLAGILTPAQLEQFDRMSSERRSSKGSSHRRDRSRS